MAIPGQANLNIGAENQVAGSDNLYEAFHTIQNNFTQLFQTSSPYDTFRAGDGVTVSANVSNGVVSITNTGVTKITAGSGITISSGNGDVTISTAPQGVAGVTRVGLTSTSLNVTGGNIVSQGNFTVDLPRLPTGAYFAAGEYVAPTVTVDGFGRVTRIANGISMGTVTSIGLAPGKGISVTGGPIVDSGVISVENTGVTSVQAGRGIQLSGSNGDITISSTDITGGTVSYVGVSSNTLTVTGGPITDAGNISIELPSSLTLTNITTGNVTATGNISAAKLTATGNVVASNATVSGNVTASNVTASGSVTANYVVAQQNLMVSSEGSLRLYTTNNLGNYVAFYAPTSIATAGLVWTLPNTLGTASQVLGTNGSGIMQWKTPPAAGANTQIQFFDTAGDGSSQLAGNANLTFNKTTSTFTVVGNSALSNVTSSGTITATGNITGGNITSNGIATVTGNITASNINASFNLTGSAVSVSGNVTGANATISKNVVVGNATSGLITTFNANVSNSLTVNNVLTVVGAAALIGNNNTVYFQANGSTTSTLVFTLPATQGNAGDILTLSSNTAYGATQWTKPKSWGAFYSTANQTNPVANTAMAMTYNTTQITSGVSIVSNSRITLATGGTYNFQFSAQINKAAGGGTSNVDIWFSKNGTIIDWTNTQVPVTSTVPAVAAWNFVEPANANDYFEIYWSSSDVNVSLATIAAQTSPTRPGTPSVILTVTPVNITT